MARSNVSWHLPLHMKTASSLQKGNFIHDCLGSTLEYDERHTGRLSLLCFHSLRSTQGCFTTSHFSCHAYAFHPFRRIPGVVGVNKLSMASARQAIGEPREDPSPSGYLPRKRGLSPPRPTVLATCVCQASSVALSNLPICD